MEPAPDAGKRRLRDRTGADGARHERRDEAAIIAAYRKGVRFLLDTQLEDGSWYVRTRAIPVQLYFDSEFPHGQDQFISAAATNWATMALAGAVR